jgi:molybdopterin synthase sulfur carrier subunit
VSDATSVTVRYWAAAKEAAGLAEEKVSATTLADALAHARARHADRPRFSHVLELSSLLIDGDPVGGRDPATVRLADGARIEVLPPFAGG